MIEQENWKSYMEHFLIIHCTIPCSVTGILLDDMALSHCTNKGLPTISSSNHKNVKVNRTDAHHKSYTKMYIDKKRSANTINYQPGKKVLIKNMRGTNSEPFYEQQPYVLIENVPQSAVLKNEKETVMKRNKGHTKL